MVTPFVVTDGNTAAAACGGVGGRIEDFLEVAIAIAALGAHHSGGVVAASEAVSRVIASLANGVSCVGGIEGAAFVILSITENIVESDERLGCGRCRGVFS